MSDKWNDREAAAKSDAEKALDDLMKKVMQAIMEDESGWRNLRPVIRS